MSGPRSFVDRNVVIRSRGYLPHWELPGASYFITFRLADSLPRSLIEQLARERAALKFSEDADRAFALRLDEALDAGHGDDVLAHPAIASTVANALEHFNGTRYDLLTWCVMPNHVHVLARLRDAIADVVHSWKSFTAHRANTILGRSGRLWSREYYDRIIRDDRELRDVSRYIMRNPEKIGLIAWPWMGTVL